MFTSDKIINSFAIAKYIWVQQWQMSFIPADLCSWNGRRIKEFPLSWKSIADRRLSIIHIHVTVIIQIENGTTIPSPGCRIWLQLYEQNIPVHYGGNLLLQNTYIAAINRSNRCPLPTHVPYPNLSALCPNYTHTQPYIHIIDILWFWADDRKSKGERKRSEWEMWGRERKLAYGFKNNMHRGCVTLYYGVHINYSPICIILIIDQ